MQLLRRPPGSQDGDEDEAPSPRDRLLRFVFSVLFLVVGMIVCFVGALTIRNPELPNYLLDRIVTQFQGTAGNRLIAGGSRSATPFPSMTPPPLPQTAEEYLDLMNYDESSLSANERAIVAILNHMVPQVMVGGPPFQLVAQQIIPRLDSLKPGDDFTQLRAAVQACRDKTNAAVRHCQDASVQLADKLIAAGMEAPMAHQVADAFSRRPLTDGHLYWPDEIIKICDSATTLSDLLSQNPSKWKLNGEKHLLFATEALSDKFQSAVQGFNAALKAINDRYKAPGK